MTNRSDRYTIERAKREHFSDFLTNFDTNPVTGYLAKAVDEQAIEQSLRNLVLTTNGDWPYESYIGSKLKGSLFDFNDDRMRNEIESSIFETIKVSEPRVGLEDVSVATIDDPNSVMVSIHYTILNIHNEIFTTDVVVNRVR